MAPLLTGRITIDSTNKWLDYNIGAGEASVSIDEDVYDDISAVLAALDAALKAVSANFSAGLYSTTHTTLLEYTGDWTILWNTGSHAASSIGAVLGYDTAANTVSQQKHYSEHVALGQWWPTRAASIDSMRWVPELVGGQRQRTISGAAVKQVVIGYRHSRGLEFHELEPWLVWESAATGEHTNRSLEAFLKAHLGDVVTFYEDHEVLSGGVGCYIDIEDDWASAMNRPHVDVETWNVRMRLLKAE